MQQIMHLPRMVAGFNWGAMYLLQFPQLAMGVASAAVHSLWPLSDAAESVHEPAGHAHPGSVSRGPCEEVAN